MSAEDRGEPRDAPTAAPSSLDVVEEAMSRAEDSYRDRASGLDTKAGLILTAAGVIVTLIGTNPGGAELAAQILSLGAGGLAVWAFFPRVAKGIAVRKLRDGYLHRDPTYTRLVLLNTRIDLEQTDERHLRQKAQRVRWSTWALLAAAVAVVVGAIVNLS